LGGEKFFLYLQAFVVVSQGGGEVFHLIAQVSYIFQCGGDVGAGAGLAACSLHIQCLLEVVKSHFELRFAVEDLANAPEYECCVLRK
jgi:hypothetical protein